MRKRISRIFQALSNLSSVKVMMGIKLVSRESVIQVFYRTLKKVKCGELIPLSLFLSFQGDEEKVEIWD